ncbi:unnamed protein product [Spirodela intermedia]|uniref:Uncharacterized protein n=1 Tax=Spirodela intermedia TaxID=51605 RepID=A0A7I8KPU4_SPIIN|nr:unnamed protein product [Spirodela intermedia]
MRGGSSPLPSCRALLHHCRCLEQLLQIHAQAITQGLLPHPQSFSCRILNAYSEFRRSADALRVFGQIRRPDLVSRTSLMKLHLQEGRPSDAADVFRQILFSGLRPDGFSVVAALSASGHMADLSLGRSLHGLIVRHDLDLETVVNNALVDMYCRSGKIGSARQVFDSMPTRDEISWSSLINGYAKQERLDVARRLFDEMPHRNAVSWTVMITAFVQGRCPIRALELFREMNSEGCRPTSVTIVGVLSACADVGALSVGCSIHGLISKTMANSDATIGNALIDMYSKSGSVETAAVIFNGMRHRDVYTWTTMILGLAVNGDGDGALYVFSEMLGSGARPNGVTFVSVLSACSHAGLVQEGLSWFDIMRGYYSLKPQIQHFGCVVDLLSRAGRLTDAEDLIGGMEIEPDAVLWRSLLSACLVHDDRRLAEVAGKRVIGLEPDDDGVHVLLWNMYASANRWDEAREIRKTMRGRRIRKRPGRSWIELNGVVREFLVEDKAHFRQTEVYSVLEGMEKQLRSHCEQYHSWIMI